MKVFISVIALCFVSLTAHAKNTYKVEPKGEVVGILLEQEAYTTDGGKIICLQNTVFMSLRKGLVYCGHRSGDSVFKLNNPPKFIPSNMHFTIEELNE